MRNEAIRRSRDRRTASKLSPGSPLRWEVSYSLLPQELGEQDQEQEIGNKAHAHSRCAGWHSAELGTFNSLKRRESPKDWTSRFAAQWSPKTRSRTWPDGRMRARGEAKSG